MDNMPSDVRWRINLKVDLISSAPVAFVWLDIIFGRGFRQAYILL